MDTNETGRFVHGVDRAEFRSLGGRLVPCSRFHAPHAVDLGWRVWWWNAKTLLNRGAEHDGTDCWYLLDGTDGEQVLREMEQWKRAAPVALELWREFLTESSADKRVILLTRISDMQDVLLAAWGVEPYAPPVWRLGFFYRTLTLDGRWLLTEHEVPPFDVSLFGRLLTPKAPLSGMARDFLMHDPVTRGMSELYQDTRTHMRSEPVGRLRVIDGGLEA